MEQVLDLLKRIDARLAALEQRVASRSLDSLLSKPFYRVAEVAKLTAEYGPRKSSEFSVRLACNDGRIPEAQKSGSGTWRIPAEAVRRILTDGLPPERRHRVG